MEMPNRQHGFSLVGLIAIVIVIILVTVILIPVMTRTHGEPMQMTDSTQLRGIQQGLALWAQNNGDRYPLPSLVDLKDQTVSDQGASKDTTANIISIMIYNGYFSPELCVSPSEVNRSVKVFGMYSYSAPASALDPAHALWDPAFSSDFSGGKTGAFSYGHVPPADARLKNDWATTWSAARAVIGNRGPEIVSMATGPRGERVYTPAIPRSNTYRIHGKGESWVGDIVYNDGHVMYESRMNPETTTYKDAAGQAWFDCLFFDEPDDPSGRNNFLGNFIKAGAAGSDFKPIWD